MCWETSANDPIERKYINRNNHRQSVKTKQCLLKSANRNLSRSMWIVQPYRPIFCIFCFILWSKKSPLQMELHLSKEMEENAMQSSLPCAKVIGTEKKQILGYHQNMHG